MATFKIKGFVTDATSTFDRRCRPSGSGQEHAKEQQYIEQEREQKNWHLIAISYSIGIITNCAKQANFAA